MNYDRAQDVVIMVLEVITSALKGIKQLKSLKKK